MLHMSQIWPAGNLFPAEKLFIVRRGPGSPDPMVDGPQCWSGLPDTGFPRHMVLLHPKRANEPAILPPVDRHFWSLKSVIYIWAGPHHLQLQAALPQWPRPRMTFSISLGANGREIKLRHDAVRRREQAAEPETRRARMRSCSRVPTVCPDVRRPLNERACRSNQLSHTADGEIHTCTPDQTRVGFLSSALL